MFPIRDENPQLLLPYVTGALIALNVAAWVFVQHMGAELGLVRSLCDLGLVPGELLRTVAPGTAVPLGDRYTCIVDPRGSWITLATHMFLHAGWLHLIGNMWFLWVFGNNVEGSMGHRRFAIFYVLCGLAAALLQMAMSPRSAIPMVGASGAIGGVMGAYVVLYPRVRVHLLVFVGLYLTTVAVPAVFMLLYWLALQLFGGFSAIGREEGGAAFWAHVGGFVAGALLVLLFRDRALVARHPYHGWSARRSRSRP